MAEHTQRANFAIYLEIPFAFLLQHVMCGGGVDTWTALGVVVVLIASAALVLWRQGNGAEMLRVGRPSEKHISAMKIDFWASEF
jgi:hypothetical protein